LHKQINVSLVRIITELRTNDSDIGPLYYCKVQQKFSLFTIISME